MAAPNSLPGMECFRLSPQAPDRLSSRSPCSVVFSDDRNDCCGIQLNNPTQDNFDFHLTPELTRLDMVSSALEWLETLDSPPQQTRPESAQINAQHTPMQEQAYNMMSYKSTGVDFDVSAAVAFSKPAGYTNVPFPQPEVATTGSNFTHPVPQPEAKKPDCTKVTQCNGKVHTGSDKEWKRGKRGVPDELKDEWYWRKRTRNNLSAKKSREAKRLKDISTARKIDELEKENAMLKMMLADLMVKQQQQQHSRPQQQRHTFPWQ